MTGDPGVIDALRAIFHIALAIEQQGHLQEHWLESLAFGRLAKWFDTIEGEVHSVVIHKLLNRANDLGARIPSAYAFEPAEPRDPPQIEAAAADMLGRLAQLRAAIGAACDAAEVASDYRTQDRLHCWARWAEKQHRKFENRIAKMRAMGDIRLFLQEMMD